MDFRLQKVVDLLDICATEPGVRDAAPAE